MVCDGTAWRGFLWHHNISIGDFLIFEKVSEQGLIVHIFPQDLPHHLYLDIKVETPAMEDAIEDAVEDGPQVDFPVADIRSESPVCEDNALFTWPHILISEIS